MKKTTLLLVQSAVIAAIYATLTILIAPISSGLLQCRLSEALCVLPYFTAAAVPGLFLGCLLANSITGAMAMDVLFGSLATLLAALCTRYLRRLRPPMAGRLLAPLPAVLVNALIIGWLLSRVYRVGASFLLCALYVGAGQALACYGAGVPLLLLLERYRCVLFPE